MTKAIKLTDDEIYSLMVAVESRLTTCNDNLETAIEHCDQKAIAYWTRELHKQDELSAKLMSKYIGK